MYKAKTTDKKKGEFNDVWVEGDLIHSGGKVYIHPISNTVNVQGELGKIIVMHEVKPETICCYVGKNDECGQKIWEHDIVAFVDITSTESGYWEQDCCGQVVWDDEEACFHVTNRLSAESYEVLDDCGVIGNVFDNPELLD